MRLGPDVEHLLERLEIGPGAEVRTVRREQHHANVDVGGELLDGRRELSRHRQVERVLLLRTREHDRAERALRLYADAHHPAYSGSPASRAT